MLFPSTLATPLLALGGVCIIISITIFHYFRDRVDSYIHDEMKNLFSTEEATAFINGIKEGKVAPNMLHDFSKQLFEIFKPQQWLKALWIYFPISGLFFIGAGLIGSFVDSNLIIDYSVYPTLVAGTAFFLLGIIQLIKLGKKLI